MIFNLLNSFNSPNYYNINIFISESILFNTMYSLQIPLCLQLSPCRILTLNHTYTYSTANKLTHDVIQ